MKTRPRTAKKASLGSTSPSPRRTFSASSNALLLSSWRALLSVYAPYGETPLPRGVPLKGLKFAALIAERMGPGEDGVLFLPVQVLGKITYLRRAAVEGVGECEDELKALLAEIVRMEDAVARAVVDDTDDEDHFQITNDSVDLAAIQYNPPPRKSPVDIPDDGADVAIPPAKTKLRSKKRLFVAPKPPDSGLNPPAFKRERLSNISREKSIPALRQANAEDADHVPAPWQGPRDESDRAEEPEETDLPPEPRREEPNQRGQDAVEPTEAPKDDTEEPGAPVVEYEYEPDIACPDNVELGPARSATLAERVRAAEGEVQLGDLELRRDLQIREKERRDDNARWEKKQRLIEQLRSTSLVLHKLGMSPMVKRLMYRACKLLEDEQL